MRDDEKARVAPEHRALFVFTAPAAIVVVVGLALVAGFTSWNLGRVRDQSLTAVRSNAADDVTRSQKADFHLCEAIGENAKTLKSVVDTAYMTSNPSIDMGTLSPESQRLLVDLLPILRLYAVAGQVNHDRVAAQVKDPPTCTRPKKGAAGPVVSTAPTSVSPTSALR